jgi:hypothetical protein
VANNLFASGTVLGWWWDGDGMVQLAHDI